jgi:hypothetical protein
MSKGSPRKPRPNHSRNIKRGKTHILILDKDDPKAEWDFEVRFQLSLTPHQRYKMIERIVLDWLKDVRQRLRKGEPLVFPTAYSCIRIQT